MGSGQELKRNADEWTPWLDGLLPAWAGMENSPFPSVCSAWLRSGNPGEPVFAPAWVQVLS